MFRAEYEVRYQAHGRWHSVPVSSSTASSNPRAAESEVRQYAPGTRHRIRYNPRDANDIRLNVSYTVRYFAVPLAFTGVGLLLAVVGLGLALRSAWSLLGRRCPACNRQVKGQYKYCPFCSAVLQPQEAATVRLEQPPKKPSKGVLIAGAFWALAGLVLLALTVIAAYREHRIISSWPEVQALVTANHLRRSHCADGMLVFHPEVEFRYVVAGRHYVSSDTSHSSSSYAWACRQLATYSPGSRHTIKYDPSSPSRIRFGAAYTLNSFLGPVVTGGMGIIFGLIGLGLLQAGRPRKARLCPACGAEIARGWKFCPNCSRPLGV